MIRRRNDRIDGFKEKIYMRDKEVGPEKEKRVRKNQLCDPAPRFFETIEMERR